MKAFPQPQTTEDNIPFFQLDVSLVREFWKESQRGLTENPRRNSGRQLRQNARKKVYTTHHRALVLHSLEVNRQIVRRAERDSKDRHDHQTTRPDIPLRNHRQRNHRFITLAIFPQQEEDEGDARSAEKTDDPSAIPWKLVLAVFEREEELDGCWREESEADEVEFVDDRVEYFFEGWFGRLIGDVDEDEEEGDQCADGKVDVET